MPHYYDLTVTLEDVPTPPWRRFLIDSEATLADLHWAIQDACGWEDRHLFEFSSTSGVPLAGVPDDEGDVPVRDASTVPLREVLGADGPELRYVYDFGDHWRQRRPVRGRRGVDEGFHRRLVGGARAFPPEDCGGVSGYAQCVDVLRAAEDDEDVRTWLGDWTPERFDLDATRQDFDADRAPAALLLPGFPHPSHLAAVEVPAATQPALNAAAEGVALLDRLRAFTRWAGDGRRLTATGNLTMAAGAELIGLLGTGDRLDQRIGDRVFKTRSTVELRGIDLTFRLARRAGFVKVQKGTVSATKRGTQLGRDPLADWRAAFTGLLDLGVLQHRYAHSTWMDPYWKELLDGQVPGLVANLLVVGRPVPLVDLQERLWQLVEASFVLDDLDEEGLRRHRDLLDRDVRSICQALADLRVVEVTDVVTTTDAYGFTVERGGEVAVTALGAAAVPDLVARR
ncbi:plasmid pRiA4b ORF-3 family protein [Georgenia yuyongxinii]|uniref:plasmid pRiA4b ORF-3 family protein n=1 Tax=Georgenia yuyongxinii TaxID=2589797 RepID=UPI00143CF112|nr:plasmid pRiA4b ORF-3 family protein [Georgenia yuyongxinii]